MSNRLAGKIALVTGGGGGIGVSIGALFVAEGAKVILVDTSDDALAAALSHIDHPNARSFKCDISQQADVTAAIASVEQTEGALDILVNNAAVREYHRLGAADAQSWQRILGVNVIGTALMTAAALPMLRKSGRGAVVNVASAFGIAGRAGMGQYDATKAAMVATTRVLAIEEAAHGVRVNAICPGSVLTGFTLGRASARGMSETDLKTKGFVPAPLSRWGEPIEIAAPVLWLASDEASFITGAVLPVDGGMSASGTRVA
jgi:2-hydroxycyclohexanecarboxyl-CoA dehydrogenase